MKSEMFFISSNKFKVYKDYPQIGFISIVNRETGATFSSFNMDEIGETEAVELCEFIIERYES